MENCTAAPDGVGRVCYVTLAGSEGGGGPSVLRDLKLIAIASVATCVGIALYNIYVQHLSQTVSEKKKKGLRGRFVERAHTDTKSRMIAQASGGTSIAASLAHIEGMSASGNFLTAVVEQMWEKANLALSNCIKDMLDETLRELPVPLHFVKFDLGDVPIKMTNMFIHRLDQEGKEDNLHSGRQRPPGIQVDVDVEWDGNCDLRLQATLSKGMKATFGAQRFKLRGRMHILLSPLTGELPVITAVQYGFTNPPEISLELTGVAHTLASKLSFAHPALISAIDSALAGIMVLPNRMVMPVDLGGYDYLDTYQPPVGMIRLTAAEGTGFKVLKKFVLKDIPDVYCYISLGASDKFRTTTKVDDLNPSWSDESRDFILYDMDQKDNYNPDDPLGKGSISVRELFRRDGTAEVELAMKGEKTGAKITVAAELFCMADDDERESFSSQEYEGKDRLCGLVTIFVTKAFDVPLPKEDCATYVKVIYGEGSDHEKTFVTGTVCDYPGYDAQNPMFDCVFHVPLNDAMLKGNSCAKYSNGPLSSLKKSIMGGGGAPEDFDLSSIEDEDEGKSERSASFSIKKKKRHHNDVTFIMIDTDGANGTKGNGELGRFTVTHKELMGRNQKAITETRALGERGAKLEFRVALTGEYPPFSVEKLDLGNPCASWRFLVLSGLEKGTVPDGIGNRLAPKKVGKSTNCEGFRLLFSTSQRGRGLLKVPAPQLTHLPNFRLRSPGFITEAEKMDSMKVLRSRRGSMLSMTNERLEQRQGSLALAKGLYGSMYKELEGGNATIRVTAVRGRGFKIKKRHMGKKDDVPDVYCKICLNGNAASVWKTATVKDDTMPQWNESRDFSNINPSCDVLHVEAYEQEKGPNDEYLGTAEFSVERLLRKRLIEAELIKKDGSSTRSYVTLRCIMRSSQASGDGVNTIAADGNTMIHYQPQLGDEGVESTLLDKNANAIKEDDEEDDGGDIASPLPRITNMAAVSSGKNGDDESVNSATSQSSRSQRMLSSVRKGGKSFRKKIPFGSKKKKKKKEESGQ
ncbi:hypothetical protein ACHAWF_016528 [Thalassiosira exigua]